MWIFDSNNKSMSTDTDAYYEAVASQEEIYLEETEEELRMILESDELSFTTDSINNDSTRVKISL